jgi:hypothetical protein
VTSGPEHVTDPTDATEMRRRLLDKLDQLGRKS